MEIETVWFGFGLTIAVNLLGLAVAYGRITTRLDFLEKRDTERYHELNDMRKEMRICPILPHGSSLDTDSTTDGTD